MDNPYYDFSKDPHRGFGNEIPCDYDCELNNNGICYFRDPENTDNLKCEFRLAMDALSPKVTAKVTKIGKRRNAKSNP